MTAKKLAYPIWTLRDDAKTIRARNAAVTDQQIHQMSEDRADQCELAAKILELYVQHTAQG